MLHLYDAKRFGQARSVRPGPEFYATVRFPVLLRMLIALIFFSACAPVKDRNPAPVLGRDPIPHVTLMEDHSEALAQWVQDGWQESIVVHVDAHDDFAWIPEDKIRKIRILIEQRNIDALENNRDRGARSLFRLSDYLYAAARTGVVKEIYWVVPWIVSADAATSGDLLRDRVLRTASRKNEGEVRMMQWRKGCLDGLLRGVPFHVCTAETLPSPAGPVLLDIDADFFPPYVEARRLTLVAGLRDFLLKMADHGLRVLAAHVALSINGGYLPPTDRYAGDVLRYLLENPEATRSGILPPRWNTLNGAGDLLRGGATDLSIGMLESALRSAPTDPDLRAMRAAARFMDGRTKQALEDARALCREDRRNCLLLVYFGDLAAAGSRTNEYEAFYRAAIEERRGWPFALERYGDSLLDRKLYAEAAEAFRGASLEEDDLALALKEADAELRMGNDKAAAAAFRRAFRYYAPPIGIPRTVIDLPDLVSRGVALFLRLGAADDAARLQKLR